MQPAAGGIGLAAELAARMQHRHDDFERRFIGKARVGVDGDAAAIVGDGQAAIALQRYLNAAGMAGDGLVHGVIKDFGGQMMKGAFVGAADIHSRAAADGFQPLQHLDMAGVVIAGGRGGGEQIAHAAIIGRGCPREQGANDGRVTL